MDRSDDQVVLPLQQQQPRNQLQNPLVSQCVINYKWHCHVYIFPHNANILHSAGSLIKMAPFLFRQTTNFHRKN